MKTDTKANVTVTLFPFRVSIYIYIYPCVYRLEGSAPRSDQRITSLSFLNGFSPGGVQPVTASECCSSARGSLERDTPQPLQSFCQDYCTQEGCSRLYPSFWNIKKVYIVGEILHQTKTKLQCYPFYGAKTISVFFLEMCLIMGTLACFY